MSNIERYTKVRSIVRFILKGVILYVSVGCITSGIFIFSHWTRDLRWWSEDAIVSGLLAATIVTVIVGFVGSLDLN